MRLCKMGMNKPNVAFVVQRYGLEVNGGAEEHCRMLAENMGQQWNIEMLTSCAKDYLYRFENEYPAGSASINGVIVRRFKIDYLRRDEKCFGEIDTKVRMGFGLVTTTEKSSTPVAQES